MMNPVIKYVIVRFTTYVITLAVAVTFVWWMFHLLPGDPLVLFFKSMVLKYGAQSQAYAHTINVYKEAFGLDKPLLEQYTIFLTELLKGNLGPSLIGFPTPVQELLRRRLPWTIGLLSISTLLAWIMGIILGALVGWKQGTKFDKIVSVLAMGMSQIPFYIFAVLGALFFGYFLNLFPTSGAYSLRVTPGFNLDFIISVIQHGTLPALSIVLTSMFGWVMSQRSLIISILGEDYLLFAEAKGLRKRRIFFTYTMRNTLLPQITALGIGLGFILSGSVIVENIFNYPGVGSLFSAAYFVLDYNSIMGFFILSIFAVLTANLIVDLLLPLIDPRIKVGG
jgi:peptide/nickel transport system permease protein